MSTDRMRTVARHFDSEASIFDARIRRLVPHYSEMLAALTAALPYPAQRRLRVLDLGCGTGTAAVLVKRAFPNAAVHCVDLSPNMLELAARKLRGFDGVTFEQADLQSYRFPASVHAVVSSLALHHLTPGPDKARVLRRVRRALVPGGVLAIADIVLSEQARLQARYLAVWAEHIRRSYSEADLWRNHARYRREDRPAVLMKELEGLQKIGFKRVEVLWKHYNFATYAAYV